MSDDPDQDALDVLSEQVHGDLASRMTAWEDGYMLTKFLVVAEVIDQSGERAVTTLTSKDMKPWEALGMLEYSKQLERADTVSHAGDDD